MAPARSSAPLQMHLSDYKTVNGIKFPHLIQSGANDETTEELVVKSIRVNPSFKADLFTNDTFHSSFWSRCSRRAPSSAQHAGAGAAGDACPAPAGDAQLRLIVIDSDQSPAFPTATVTLTPPGGRADRR